jgi:hypothetical protein
MARLSMLPSTFGTVSASGMKAFAVQWLAYAFPCRRFTDILADACARLGADVDRYSFTVRDLHPRLLAGFAGALRNPSQKRAKYIRPFRLTACSALVRSRSVRQRAKPCSPRPTRYGEAH